MKRVLVIVVYFICLCLAKKLIEESCKQSEATRCKPFWTSKRDAKYYSLVVKETLSLCCPAAGIPKPNIVWKKDGEKLSSRGRHSRV